jgi:hypothetical protein
MSRNKETSPVTYREALTSLAAALPMLSARDASFGESLLTQAREHDTYKNCPPLSGKQWEWVVKLADKAKTPAAPVAKIDFSAVTEMFAAASKVAKRLPKIRLQLPDGSPIVLKPAGPGASRPGTVNVTDGKAFGNNVWYGRVDPVSGAWEPSSKVDLNTTASVTALLTAFAANPLQVAAEYGAATHHCCFCGIELTDPRSKKMGWGPICAEKFGLEWGEK